MQYFIDTPLVGLFSDNMLKKLQIHFLNVKNAVKIQYYQTTNYLKSQ